MYAESVFKNKITILLGEPLKSEVSSTKGLFYNDGASNPLKGIFYKFNFLLYSGLKYWYYSIYYYFIIFAPIAISGISGAKVAEAEGLTI